MITSSLLKSWIPAILGQDLYLEINGDSGKRFCHLADVKISIKFPVRSDSVLPSFITPTPLVVAALFVAIDDNGVVTVDRLREVLNEVSQNSELMKIYDSIAIQPTTTIGTS